MHSLKVPLAIRHWLFVPWILDLQFSVDLDGSVFLFPICFGRVVHVAQVLLLLRKELENAYRMKKLLLPRYIRRANLTFSDQFRKPFSA